MTTAIRPLPPPKNANEAGHRRAEGRRRFKQLTTQRRKYLIDRWAEYTEAVFGDEAAKAMQAALTKYLKGVPLRLVDDDRSFEANDRLIMKVLPGLPPRGK